MITDARIAVMATTIIISGNVWPCFARTFEVRGDSNGNAKARVSIIVM